MQFNWVKLCSKLGSSAKLLRIILLIGIGISPYAKVSATVILSPGNGGSITPAGSATFYYFVQFPGSNAVASPAFTTVTPIDISKTAATEANIVNVVEINFFSDAALNVGSGQQAVVAAQISQVTGTAATGTFYAPIASVNGVPCNDVICQNRQVYNGLTRYYSARYAGARSTIRLGFYLSDICLDYGSRASIAAQGCTAIPNSSVSLPTAANPTSISLMLATYTAPDTNPVTAPTATPLDKGSVILSLSDQTPTFSCPSLVGIYAPGDGQILLNTSRFGLSNAGGVPIGSIILVAREQGAEASVRVPDVSNTYTRIGSSGNTFYTEVPYKGSPGEPFGGFANSEYEGQHTYNVSFIVRNSAGVSIPPSDSGSGSSTSCVLPSVQTTAIQAFVTSSNCFIASAAFHSIESQPVLLLRDFRDRFLLKFEIGQTFVSWYYGWSPQAATWILEHPLFRLPALLFLVPFELIAWFTLHPLILLMCLLGSLSVMGYYLMRERLDEV